MKKTRLLWLSLVGLILLATSSLVDASTSKTKTYHFIWGTSYLGSTAKYEWWITAPIYAAPGDAIILHLSYYFHTALTVTTERLEVTVTLSNGKQQQIHYSIFLQGTYSAGTSGSTDASMAIPSNTKLGSSLKVEVYTDLNNWALFPTEIRQKSYDALELENNNLQSEVDTLESEKSSLESQLSSLQTDKSSLQSQVNNLESELKNIRAQNTSATSLALLAIVIAAVFVVTTVYFATRKPKVKTA